MENRTAISGYFCLSLWPLDLPWSHLITWIFFTCLLSPITILSNSLLIYALYKTNQLVNITNKLIFLMSISDLCTGIFVLPSIVVMISLKDKFRSCIFERIMQYFAFMLAYFSFFMLMCVSLDRYIHVTKLNRYNDYINEFRMKIAATVSFILSAVIACISVTLPAFWLQVLLNFSDLLGVLLMCTLYALAFRKIQFHSENFKRMLGNLSATSADKKMKHELSATKTIRLVLVALLILYLPYNIASAVWTYHKFKLQQDPGLILNVLEYWAYLIVFSNAAVNATIFAYGNSKTRNYIKNRFRNSDKVYLSSLEEDKNDTGAVSTTADHTIE